jgi:biofilm PGA synthesis N-glycosyltransferase PgaC
MKLIFWFLVVMVFYSYIGYGALVWLLVKIRGRYGPEKLPEDMLPSVSMIVPCYNEQDYVGEKVKNSRELDYPEEKLQLIFVSDGSSDDTAAILSRTEGIIHLHEQERKGKAAAMNRAVKHAGGEILVFCDANTSLNREAIRLLVKHYADPETGGVSGEKKILLKKEGGVSSAGEDAYWKYESFLKKGDSDLYTLAGAAGELMSYRRELYEELEPDTILDDFMQSMRIVLKGYRMVYEPEALALETASENVKEEMKRKIRICAGGWQSMSRLGPAFNFFRRPLAAFIFISHRVLRWSLAAFALPFIFLLNFFLLAENSCFYLPLLLFQVLFYSLALLGWYLEKKNKKWKISYVPYYFVVMNAAVFAGFKRFLAGEQTARWEKARRAS